MHVESAATNHFAPSCRPSPVLRRALSEPAPGREDNIRLSAEVIAAEVAAWSAVLSADAVLSPEVVSAHTYAKDRASGPVVVWLAASEAVGSARSPGVRLRRALEKAVEAAAPVLVDLDPDAVALRLCLEDMRLWGLPRVTEAAADLRRAVDRMERANLRLVHRAASKMLRRGHATDMTVDDLIGHGMEGLRVAVMRYRASRGTAFSTFAVEWIESTIGRAIDNLARPIRIPVTLLQGLRRLSAVRGRHEDATDEQLAAMARVPLASLADMRALLAGSGASILSLDAPRRQRADDEAELIGESIPSDAPSPEEAVENLLRRGVVRRLLACIGDERVAAAICWHFGLDGAHDEGASMRDIAHVLGVTRQGVDQMIARGLERMRRHAAEQGLAC